MKPVLGRKDTLQGSQYLLRRSLPSQHGAHHAQARTLRTQLAVAESLRRQDPYASVHGRNDGSALHWCCGPTRGNGRWLSFQSTGNGPYTEAALSHRCNGDPILGLKPRVSGRFLHAHALQEEVLDFIFEAAIYILMRSFASNA